MEAFGKDTAESQVGGFSCGVGRHLDGKVEAVVIQPGRAAEDVGMLDAVGRNDQIKQRALADARTNR